MCRIRCVSRSPKRAHAMRPYERTDSTSSRNLGDPLLLLGACYNGPLAAYRL